MSQLLNPAAHPASLWTVSCKRWAPSSPGTRRGGDVAQSAERHNAVGRVCQGNMLKPIKVRWPNSSCWGSRSPPPPHAANTPHPCAQYSLPTHSARALNCLFNLTHNYRGNICVFCTSATAPRRKPTAKSSQLPLQLSQPESLIKTRCFHLGQLWKKSLPEWGPAPAKAGCRGVCHVWQSWHSHCTKGGFFFFFFLFGFSPNVLLNQTLSTKAVWVWLSRCCPQSDAGHDVTPPGVVITSPRRFHLCQNETMNVL